MKSGGCTPTYAINKAAAATTASQNDAKTNENWQDTIDAEM